MNNRRFQTIKHSFTKNKFVAMGVIILAILTVASIFAFVSPYDPSKMSIPDRLQEPSMSHPFGTDDYGRDYLTERYMADEFHLRSVSLRWLFLLQSVLQSEQLAGILAES